MTESQAAKLIAMLITAWPDGMRWLSDEQQANTRRLYREFLRDLPYDAGDAAVRRLIAIWKPSSARGWPTIAELRATIRAQQFGRPLVGAEAWGEIQRLIKKFGAHRVPGVDFGISDPVVNGIVEIMGWRELCLSENPTADRARVIELCEQLSAREVADRAVGQLAPPIPVRRLAAPGGAILADIVQKILPKPEDP